MKLTATAALLTCACALFSCKKEMPSFSPVKNFNLTKYLGTWYEIARLPASFEKDMDNVTACYSLKKDGTVKVENAGLKKGKPTKAIGKAMAAGAAGEGYLRVSFFGPFYADYVVVELAEDYSYAMVASSTKYLWILSRSPVLQKDIVDRLVAKATSMGIDTGKLIFTRQ